MKADRIHVSHFDFIAIEKLEIDRAAGDHGTALLRGSIRDKDVEDYRRLLLEKIWVQIDAEDDGGERRPLMVGIIAGFSLEVLPHSCVLEVVLKSGTYLMDGKKHFRSFQDQSYTYLDVMKAINQPYGETGVIGEDRLSEKTDFLLQYNETDWEFVQRISSRFGMTVTPSVMREGIFYYVGNSQYVSYTLPDCVSFHTSKNVGAYLQNGANGIGSLREHDYEEYRICVREIYDLWDLLVVGDIRGHVCRIHSAYRQGELIHTYWLRSAAGIATLQVFNESQQGCSFQAEVKAVMRDKVQVALIGDENANQNITRWFPYSTGYSSTDGAGWYCMPEVGDRVRLQIPNHMEEQGYVISAVHMDTESDRKNPDYKSFKTRYGKELLLTPDRLELTNNKGMSVIIKDGEGIQMVSDKDISIVAEGSMTISSQEASLVIAGTESVDIKQGEASLHMDNNITFTGGKFRVQ